MTMAEAPPPEPTGEPEPKAALFSDEQMQEISGAMIPLIEAAMVAAIEAAVASTPVPIFRPATVTGMNVGTTNTVTVRVDGDESGTAVTAAILGEWPIPGDRVLILQAPGGAVWCVSIIGHGGVPAGSCIAYLGTITTDAPSSGDDDKVPPGFIRPYGRVTTQSLHPGLFAAIGTVYNTGGESAQNGEYRTPDCRGRIFIGLDNMGGSDAGRHTLANSVGTVGGSNVIDESSLPSHVHSFTPSGSVSIDSISADVSGTIGSDGSHTHADNGHSHLNAWGGSYVVAAGGDYPASGSDGGGTGTGYANLAYDGTHDHSFSGSLSNGSGTASFTGTTDDTGSVGSGAQHLPPVMVCNWILKV